MRGEVEAPSQTLASMCPVALLLPKTFRAKTFRAKTFRAGGVLRMGRRMLVLCDLRGRWARTSGRCAGPATGR
ncbi:hypothetical protein N9T38_01465 [SAR116 cluster bacterium]|nr:hypothetical protein [SAR116 cluster bacterium]